MSEQAETRPEWGQNPNHACDALCELWAHERREQRARSAEIEDALRRFGEQAARPAPDDAAAAPSDGN